MDADPVQAVVRFFRALDDREYDALAGMLAPGGVWERQGAELRSRGDVMAAMAKRSPTLRIHHLLTNLFAVEHGEAEAEVTGYMLVVRHDSGTAPDGPSPLQGIENIRTVRARMRRTAEGWRVQRLASDPAAFAVAG
jgi:ketosteroid isomerase-like protein